MLLLTQKKPFSYLSTDGDGLVMHFAKSLAEGNLTQILDPQVREEGGQEVEEVATLAALCIKLTSDDRPTMRQVEVMLEGLRRLTPRNSINDNIVGNEFEQNDYNGTNFTSTKEWQNTEESGRIYSMEQELLMSARYPR